MGGVSGGLGVAGAVSSGRWSVVGGQWSAVSGQGSGVSGRWLALKRRSFQDGAGLAVCLKAYPDTIPQNQRQRREGPFHTCQILLATGHWPLTTVSAIDRFVAKCYKCGFCGGRPGRRLVFRFGR